MSPGKALYFCFAYWGSFVRNGKKAVELSEIDVSNYEEYLFDDDIEAWVYGPVVPSVYKACKDGTLENYREQKKEIFADNLIKDYINGILKNQY